MGRHFLFFCLCFLTLRGSYASVTPEDYWKSKLPTTPMPQAIKDSFAPFGGGISGPPATTTKSLASTSGYTGLLSYNKNKDSKKNSLSSTSGYTGLLSYSNKDSTKNSLASMNSYGGLLSYAKSPTKDSLASTSGYDGSYAKSPTKDSLASTSGYDGSYAKSPTKDSLASTSGYDGSYAKSPTKDSLASTSGYDGSYAKSPTKDSLASTSGYDGSYAKSPTKDSLASTSGYDGSYAKSPTKDSLASTSGYDGSYAKSPTKDSLASTSGYDGSYAKSPTKDSLASTSGYDGSYAKNTPNAPTDIGDRVFFVEENLQVGRKMNLVFKRGTKRDLFFLPREVSSKIPFSSDKLQEIYGLLSLDPKSHEAYVLSRRIELCEEASIEGVEKQCVTSLESMVDFVVSKMGKNVKALSTVVEKDHSKMEYTIHKVKQIAKKDRSTVVCHKMGYPYALFFCHRTATIRSYMVSLVGTDGTKIQAVAACHKETNEFLSNYMINVLKVTPGSTRVCHFPVADDNIIWVAN